MSSSSFSRKGSCGRINSRLRRLLHLALTSALSMPLVVQAAPTGGTVVSGSASIAGAGNLTTITAANNSVLRWDSFNVASNQTVQFVQPSNTARVLNWIGGAAPSQIDGTLKANGQVYLANPSGIYFGSTAVVDATRLYAIGGAMTQEDFIAGNDRFTQLTGDIRNAGSLRGSTVALVGRTVANSGSIVSPGGFIALAAGDQVYLGKKGSSVYVDTGTTTTAANATITDQAGVNNSGTVDAGSGSVSLAAGDLYSVAITHSGVLRGSDVRVQGQGRGLVVVDGRIDASHQVAGQPGGQVQITGEQVGLTANAAVNASGAAGGGTILVGGDTHGANPEVRNAQTTTVLAGATLMADATTTGDGGKVVVWSDQSTSYAGSIFARALGQTGNGGFAEISGKHLGFVGTANVTSLAGLKGSVLLDPTDLTISNNPDTGIVTSVGSPPFFVDSDIGPSNVSWASILGLLATGDVIVGTGAAGPDQGTITVTASPVGYNTASNLTLTTSASTFGNIVINAPMINQGAGNISLNSNNDITLGGTAGTVLVSTAGSLFLGARGNIQGPGTLVGGSSVILNSSNGGIAGDSGTPIVTSTGSLTVGTDGGTVRNRFDGGMSVLVDSPLGNGNFDITSRNTADTADAPIVATPSGAMGSLRLAGSNLTVSTIGGMAQITLANSGTLTIQTSSLDPNSPGTIIFESTGNVGSAATPLDVVAANVIFNKTGGDTYLNYGFTVNLSGVSSGGLISLASGYGADAIVVGSDGLTAPQITLNGLSVQLLGPITATTTTITSSSTIDGPGLITSPGLSLKSNGDTGNAEQALATSTSNLTLTQNSGGNVYLHNTLDVGLTVTGTVTGQLQLVSNNLLDSATAPLIIGAGGLASNNIVTLNASTVALNGALNGNQVTINNDGAVTGTGLITAPAVVMFNNNGDVGTGAAPINTNTEFLQVNKPAGQLFVNNGANDLEFVPENFGGGGAISARRFTLSGSIDVTRLNDFAITATDTIDFNSFSVNARTLTLTHTNALVNYGGVYSADTLVLAGNGSVGTITQPFIVSLSTGRTAAAGTLVFNNKGLAPSAYITNSNDAGVIVRGTAADVTSLTSQLSATAAAAPLIVDTAGVNAVDTITLNGSTLTFNGIASALSLIFNNSGAASGAGALQATQDITLQGAGDFGALGTPLGIRTLKLIVNKTAGGVYVTNSSNSLQLLPTQFTGGGTIANSVANSDLTLTGPINLGRSADLSLVGSNINLGNFAVTARSLTIGNDLALTNVTGPISADSLTLSGHGDAGTVTSSLAVNIGQSTPGAIQILKDNNSHVYLTNRNDGGINLNGTTNSIDLISSRNTADTAAAPLLTSSAGFTSQGAVTLTSSTLSVGGVLAAPSLTLDTSAATTNAGGTVQAPTLTLLNSGAFGTLALPIVTTTNLLNINKPAGAVYINDGATALTLTPTAFSGGGAFTAGSFTLQSVLNVGTNPLAITTTTGTLNLQSLAVTAGALTLNNAGQASDAGLVTATAGLTLQGAGDVTLSATNTPTVTINKTGGFVVVNNGANNLAIVPTAFTGGGAFSGANLSLSGPINVGTTAVTFTSTGTLNLNSFVITGNTLELDHDGALLNFAAPVVSFLTLGGSGADGSTATHFVTSVAHLDLNKTGSGSVFIDNRLDAGVIVNGTSTASISITSRNSANTAAATLTLGSTGLSDPTGSLVFDGSQVNLGGDLTSNDLTINHSLQIFEPVTVTLNAATRITFNGNGNVGSSALPVFTNSPALTVNEATGPVFLSNTGANLSLAATNLSGGGTVSTSGNLALSTAISAGASTLVLSSGGAFAMGTNAIVGGDVTISDAGALTGTGGINANKLTLTGAGAVGTATASVATQVAALTINKASGTSYVDNGTTALAFTPAAFSGGGVIRGGNLSLLVPISAAGSFVGLTSYGTLSLGANAITADSLILWHNGALSNLGSLNVTTLGFGGSADDGTSASHLVLSVPNLQLRKTGSAAVYIDNHLDAGLIVSGSSNANLFLSSLNTAGTSAAPFTIGAGGLKTNGTLVAGIFDNAVIASADRTDITDVVFAPDANSSAALSGSAVTLNGNVTSGSITMANSGTASGSGSLVAGNQVTLNGGGDVGTTTAALSSNTPSVVVDKTGGTVFLNNNGQALSFTPTNFKGGGAISSGNFTLQGPIDVTPNNLTITSSGTLDLGSNTVAAKTLKLSNAGVLSGSGIVTSDSLQLSDKGDVGKAGTPLVYSGPSSSVIVDPGKAAIISYNGGIPVIASLPPPIAQAVAAIAQATGSSSSPIVVQEEPAGTPESESPTTTKTSKRTGGAAFRSISSRADLLSAAREQLQALGIYARPLTEEERDSRSRKEAVFTAVPEKLQPKESDFEVVDARIDPNALREVLRLASETGLTEPGKTHLEQVAHSLANTFTAFSAASPSGEAAPFRAWLEARQDEDSKVVLGFIATLRSTIRQIELLGLTRQEIEVSKSQIYGSILRPGLNADPDFLRALIEEKPATKAAVLPLPAKGDRVALKEE